VPRTVCGITRESCRGRCRTKACACGIGPDKGSNMIDQSEMQSLLENMEGAAERALQRDPAFFETLQALKQEIEGNLGVRSAMLQLQTSGQRAFTSLVPRINIRVRTADGILGLPRTMGLPEHQRFAALIGELRKAATAVIQGSGHGRELNAIVNEAIGSSTVFEQIASRLEREGYEIIICLDFSPYAQLRRGEGCVPVFERESPAVGGKPVPATPFSNYDLQFLRALRIRTDL
jgi:hypothetical protein